MRQLLIISTVIVLFMNGCAIKPSVIKNEHTKKITVTETNTSNKEQNKTVYTDNHQSMISVLDSTKKGSVVVKINPYIKDFSYELQSTPNSLILSKRVEQFMHSYQESLQFYNQHRYREAISSIDTAMKVLPNISIAYQLKGTILYQQNKLRIALSMWEKALDLDPSSLTLLNRVDTLKNDLR